MELKDWVRAARAHKGWTQQQLGDAVGRTKATSAIGKLVSTLQAWNRQHRYQKSPDFRCRKWARQHDAQRDPGQQSKRWDYDPVSDI